MKSICVKEPIIKEIKAGEAKKAAQKAKDIYFNKI